MRISDWSSDVCSSDLVIDAVIDVPWTRERFAGKPDDFFIQPSDIADEAFHVAHQPKSAWSFRTEIRPFRSEEHTSELQSLMRISYAVFCLQKKKETDGIQMTKHHQTSHFNNHIRS